MIRFLILTAAIICFLNCGGGGGGSGGGQAGDKSSLRALNAIADTSSSLSILVISENDTAQDDDTVQDEGTLLDDESQASADQDAGEGRAITQQSLFSALKSGQASEYKPIVSGIQTIRYFEETEPQEYSELVNEFNIAAPYSLIIYRQKQNLNQILAINDRSDTPQGKIRIRAANVREESISFSLVGTTPTSAPTAVPTVQETSDELDSKIIPGTQAAVVEKVIVASLPTGQISNYSLLDRGDYRIQISDAKGIFYTSEPITFNPNQIETIVVTDLAATIIRLNDKP